MPQRPKKLLYQVRDAIRLPCILIVKEHYGKLLSTLFWPVFGPANEDNLTFFAIGTHDN